MLSVDSKVVGIAIEHIAAVEDVLLEREPIFQRYELELWRRIAIVLTDRGDIRRLYNSGLKYIRFLKEISEKVTIRDEAVDAIEAYCVGLHNAEAVDEYGAFLKKCGELTQLLADNKRIAVICCQNYGRLMHLRLYKNVNAEIQEEWNAIVEILKQCNYDEDVYKNVLDGCAHKNPSMRFSNRTIVSYRTNVLVSHCIPQNHFR